MEFIRDLKIENWFMIEQVIYLDMFHITYLVYITQPIYQIIYPGFIDINGN